MNAQTHDAYLAIIDAVEARLAALEAAARALVPYARHTHGCGMYDEDDIRDCTCGYDARYSALAALLEEERC